MPGLKVMPRAIYIKGWMMEMYGYSEDSDGCVALCNMQKARGTGNRNGRKMSEGKRESR